MLGAALKAHIVKPGNGAEHRSRQVPPKRSVLTRSGRQPSPMRFSAVVSTKVVDPQTNASGCWLAGQTVCASIAALTGA